MGVVLGVDRCAGQWLGILLEDGGGLRGILAAGIADLVADAERLAGQPPGVVAIDIPIGLPDRGPRRADDRARTVVGPRASSVFPVPVRRAVEDADYTRASALNLELSGWKISKQSHSLRAAILDVDGWLRAGDRPTMPVVEVHPEVCFATLAGEPLLYGKKNWSGVELRRRLLAGAGIAVPADLGIAGVMAAPDDVLDAAVAAWTARRVVVGTAVGYPDPPQQFSDGLAAAIRA